MGLYKEGIPQAKEASEILEQLSCVDQQADSLISLALLLHSNQQLNTAEEARLLAIDLLPEKSKELRACQAHHALGNICQSKDEMEKAIHHLEIALGIASSLDWVNQLFWAHSSLVKVFSEEDKFDDAQTHLKRTKLHAVNNVYLLAYVAEQQAWIWYGLAGGCVQPDGDMWSPMRSRKILIFRPIVCSTKHFSKRHLR